MANPAEAPLVTAVLPTYNGADFIQRTLDSLAAQTWPNLEILIGDDRSTDDTLLIVEEFAAAHPNTRVLERTENLGWLRNTNDLMANAKGEFMFFAFHYDVVAPTYVEKLVRALQDNPRAVLSFSDMQLYEVDGRSTFQSFTRLEGKRSALGRGLMMVRRPGTWWVPNRGLFRADAYRRVDGIHPNDQGEYSADWTWLLHLSLIGEFVRVPEVLCEKYYQKGSLSKTWPHNAAQRAALRKAGVVEIANSPLNPLSKAVLVASLLVYSHLPKPVKRPAQTMHIALDKLRARAVKWFGSRQRPTPADATMAPPDPMRVLVSAAWLGGAGGAERALHSVLRALPGDHVDVVVREQLDGPYAQVGANARVFSLYDWRWRWANMRTGVKGSLVQRVVNPLRRFIMPGYDIYLQFFSGADLNDTIRAKVRLLIPSGNEVPPEKATRFDAIALQAPDNVRFVPPGARTVLLAPPVHDLAERAEPPAIELPERFYLTVFNPYGGVKGSDDLARVVDSAPFPIVWCHSQATVAHNIPEELAHHPRIVHVEDATREQLRYLYEHCDGYVSLSKTEGFGWSIADALRYSPAVYSRRVGVLTFPEGDALAWVQCDEDLHFDWDASSGARRQRSTTRNRLDWLSAGRFRRELVELVVKENL